MTIKWDFFGGGIGVVGIGLTLLLALPPPGWPKMPPSTVHFWMAFGQTLMCVGVAIFLIGIWPGQLENHIGPLIVFAVGVGFAISAGMWWHWQSVKLDDADNNLSLNGRILVECNDAGLPSIMPAMGNLFHLMLHPEVQVAQLGRFTLAPGAPVNWGFKRVAACKCEVKNFSKMTISHLRIPFKVSFYESIETGSGKLIKDEDQPIPIPALTDNASEPFEFYVYNASNLYVTLLIPEEASVWLIGDDEARTVKLMKPTFYRGVPLHPAELATAVPTIVQP